MTSETKSISTILASVVCVLSLAANADRHWTGGGETTDWSDSANWGAGNGSGNWVFGGGQIGQYPSSPDPVVVTFSNLVEIANGVWIENESKPNVVWRMSEDATEDAGLKSTWGNNNSLNIGTGKHGGLTIESGVYYMPKQLWIGNGAVDSYFTLNGGVFTNGSYTCIGYGGYARTATMTVNDGKFRQNGDKFIIGQGNNTGCIGVYNQTGGEVSVPEIFMSENKGSSSLTVSGGTFTNRGYASIGRGTSTTGEVFVAGGTYVNEGEFVVGYADDSYGKFSITNGTCDMQNLVRFGRGTNSKVTVLMSGGDFDTDNECILCTGTGSEANMILSGGTFTPKKFWIGSQYDQTSSGCEANFTMTGGSLATDSGQDIVIGGHNNAVGTFDLKGGIVSAGDNLHVAWRGSGRLNMTGGEVTCKYLTLASDNADAVGKVVMSNGVINSSGNITIGQKGDGLFEMSGGNLNGTTTSAEFWIGGSGNSTSGNNGSGKIVMTGGQILSRNWTSVGRNGTGILEIKGGVFEVNNNGIEIARYGSSTGIVVVAGGTLTHSSGNQYFAVGQEGSYGALIVSNGTVTANQQIQVAKGSVSKGHVEVHGGEVVCNHLFQVGLNGTGTLEMDGGSVTCNGFRLGTDGASAVGTATITGGMLTSTAEVRVGGNGTGTLNMNGGVVEANKVDVGSGAGTLNLNGGTLRARQDETTAFLANSANLTVNVGAGGAVFDTAGHNVTVPATLNNAAELAGANGMIWKKGLGTLTISSDLDLERTFKFTIDQGVGPIALTGESNTLGEGDKLAVEIDPVYAQTNVAYTVLTGLGSLTKADMTLPAQGEIYTYDWSLEDGTLAVTLTGYLPGAAVTARYENGEWVFYDADGNVATGAATESTAYVFSGSVPAGALESVPAGNLVIFQSGTVGYAAAVSVGSVIVAENAEVTLSGNGNAFSATTITILDGGSLGFDSAVNAGLVEIPADASATVEGSGAATFTVAELAHDGTLAFAGEIVLDALLAAGNVAIAEGAVVHLAKSQTITSYIGGAGEIVVDDGVTVTVGETWYFNNYNNPVQPFTAFSGTFTLAEGAVLSNETHLHGENSGQGPYYFLGENATLKMAGGSISRFTAGSNGTNHEYIKNLVVADGTSSTWNNQLARTGGQGVMIHVTGDVSGSGVLEIFTKDGGADSNRGPHFEKSNAFVGFSGELRILSGNAQFAQGVGGGTVVMASGTHVHQTSTLTVDNAMLVLKGNQGKVIAANDNITSAGTYSIGANAALKVGESASVEGVTFAAGATLEMLDDGALSDRTHEYVALTSATPITGALPTLVQPPDVQRGKWKLVQKTIPGEGEDPDTYQIVAEFRPSGFMIIVQ